MTESNQQEWEIRLLNLFGRNAKIEGPLTAGGAGRRLVGIDLSDALTPDQISFLLDALAHFGVVCIAGQDLNRFSLARFERFANHWGAPVPHPSNFLRGGKPAQSDGDSTGPIEWLPFDQRRVASVNEAFPDQLTCLPHESPTVLVVTNFRGSTVGRDPSDVTISNGGSWHTDIEYEPLPIYVSMFLCHKSPQARGPSGTWVEEQPDQMSKAHPYLEDSDPELLRLRKNLPLNGETAFADTAAALAALPPSEQASLEDTMVRRRLNEGDDGWLAPLVRTNPRSGIKSLHSPIWASRPRVRPPIEVDGMTMEASRAFLDRLEAHVLQPQFRYDHHHVSGDVTIWDNYMTLHNSPSIKSNIVSQDDARLLYRLSCKGEPALTLPRSDQKEWLEANISGSYTTPSEIINPDE
jgi:alpha-ketoglutarate-dependent taurine dioxygenase